MSENLIFEAVVGSRLVGANQDNSDYDIVRVELDSIESLLGRVAINFTALHEKRENFDITTYGLRHFMMLACNGNPTALEIISINEGSSQINKETDTWRLIRNNRGIFRTQYASARLIENVLNRLVDALSNAMWSDSGKKLYNVLRYAFFAFAWRMTPDNVFPFSDEQSYMLRRVKDNAGLAFSSDYIQGLIKLMEARDANFPLPQKTVDFEKVDALMIDINQGRLKRLWNPEKAKNDQRG